MLVNPPGFASIEGDLFLIMISNYLDRTAVLAEFRDKRALLGKTLKFHTSPGKDGETARALLAEYEISPGELPAMIQLLDIAIEQVNEDKGHPAGTAFIPSSPLVCNLQAGMTRNALAGPPQRLERNVQPAAPAAGGAAARGSKSKSKSGVAADTSAPMRLRKRPAGKAARKAWGGFIENDDVLYALKGAQAKAASLMKSPRAFNPNPAVVRKTSKPLSLYLFGDWGTGLPLARQVTKSIYRQVLEEEPTTQAHIIHLGDVYYVGEPAEYTERMLADGCWPLVTKAEIAAIGSWSLNGNHDRYCGGHGYFDTLLRDERFRRWHADKNGEPSSFFLIENDDWQIFGLDTSWELPTLGEVTTDAWTMTDYAGQNGILTFEQVDWMRQVRDPAKGCVLLTHHQPASSRTSEKQHADATITALKTAGVYDTIDAWIWGHEHRAVVFHPRAKRVHQKLKTAPPVCCCLGHGGVPVTSKNFELDKTIPDVLWQEDRLGATAPMYERKRVLPFGFGKLETSGSTFRLTVFDHTGDKRYQLKYTRGQEQWEEIFRAPAAAAPAASKSTRSRGARATAGKKSAAVTRAAPRASAKRATSAKKAAKKAAKKVAKKAAKKAVKKAAKKVSRSTKRR